MKLKLKTKNVVMIAIIVISLLLSTSSISLAQSGTWTPMADMPTARWALSTCAVDGKIYAFGGYATDHTLATVEEYDCVTNSWTKKKNMPRDFMGFSTSMVNGKIYLIGGGINTQILQVVYEYDPVTTNYTKKQDMLSPRVYLSTSTVNSKIYAIGGAERISGSTISGFYATVEEYDPSTDTWTLKTSSMPGGARCALATSVVNGKIYAIGGYKSGDVVVSTVEEYDPATDTWTTKKDMPTPRGWLSTSVVDENIYAIGGIRDYIVLSTVEVYDPATDTWKTDISPLPTARCALSTSVVDGEIYAIGGQINFSGPPWDPGLKTVEKFDPLATSVKNMDGIQNNPTKFLLHQNYPNPFNPSTTIVYSIPEPGFAIVKVYDLVGREIQILVNKFVETGTHSINFDASNLPSGMYIYKLQVGDLVETRKMLLMR